MLFGITLNKILILRGNLSAAKLRSHKMEIICYNIHNFHTHTLASHVDDDEENNAAEESKIRELECVFERNDFQRLCSVCKY